MAMPKTKKKFEEIEWCNSKETKRNNNRLPNHRVVLIPSIWGQVDSLGSSNFMSLISKGKGLPLLQKCIAEKHRPGKIRPYLDHKWKGGKKTVVNTQLSATK